LSNGRYVACVVAVSFLSAQEVNEKLCGHVKALMQRLFLRYFPDTKLAEGNILMNVLLTFSVFLISSPNQRLLQWL